MIPKPVELEFSVLGRWLDRARDVLDKTSAEARELLGDGIMCLDNEELLDIVLEMDDEESLPILQYLDARLWQERLTAQRLEGNILSLNASGAMVERHWDVSNPPFSRMQKVYEAQKERYYRDTSRG